MTPVSLLLCVLSVAYLVWRYIVYPTFISPLSKIPNAHFSVPINPFWMLWRRYIERENRTIHEAHRRYGKIVRLGPNEVSVASVDDGIRIIYGGGFEKWKWYANQFDNFGVPCMFSMSYSKPHSVRKRMISNIYSKSFVQTSPDFHKVSEVIIIDRLLPIIAKAADDQTPKRVLDLNFRITMDFICCFTWGLRNGTNFLQEDADSTEWLRTYQSRRPYRFWQGELPVVQTLSSRIGLPIVPKWVDRANEYIEDWCMSHCRAAEVFNAPSEDKSATTSSALVFDQLTNAVASNTKASADTYLGAPVKQVASEILDHIAAGHDTSGIALTYAFWELSKHPSLQVRLREELLTLSPAITISSNEEAKRRELPSARSIADLPLLHAILMETLRLHPSIPGPQPRITPSPPVSVAGSPPLDAGIRISAQPYTLHRNEDVFPDAEEWKPQRWLEAGREQKAEMMKWFWAFGSGGRMCVGSHVAMQEMKLITAAIYSNFTTKIIDDEGIEQVDAYTAGPCNGIGPALLFERL